MNISFEEINDLKDKGTVAFYDGEFKKSYRIVVPYNNKVYAIFWFEVSSDGSLYCGIRDRQSKRMASGVLECQDGTLTVKYSDMDFKSKPTKDRISFHASGEIHCPGTLENSYRIPLSDVKKPEELFHVVFKEVSCFEEIQTFRKTDLLTLMYIPPSYSPVLTAIIAPFNSYKPLKINNGNNNFTAVINYESNCNTPSVSLQLTLTSVPIVGDHQLSTMIFPCINQRINDDNAAQKCN